MDKAKDLARRLVTADDAWEYMDSHPNREAALKRLTDDLKGYGRHANERREDRTVTDHTPKSMLDLMLQ